MAMTKRQHNYSGDTTRPDDEWEQDVKALANKVMKVVAGYAASDAIAAMAVVTKHILDRQHD
jgi:hypothetical protein